MLEHSLWHQYCASKTIREVLAGLYRVDIGQFRVSEGELYAIMKRQLTKRELRLFIMKEGGKSMTDIQQSMGLSADHYSNMEHKAYRKFKIDKLKNALLAGDVSNVDNKTDYKS